MNLDMNALTNALTTIVNTIQLGNEEAVMAMAWVTDVLGIIEVVLWGASVLLGSEALAGFVKKFLALQFWLWIIRGFHALAKGFMKTLVAGAFKAGGGSGGIADLLDPSHIAGKGLDATMALAMHIDNLGKWDIGDKVVLGFVLMIVMACFILMAVNVMWAVIEFYIFLNLSGLLIPFAIFPSTRFIADKGINAVLASALKLAVFGFVIALIVPVLEGIDFHKTFGAKESMNWNDIWSLFAVSFFLLGLCWKAPHVAAGLIHGSPTLSGSGAVMAMAGMALWGASQAGQGLVNAIGAGASGVRGMAQKLSDWGDAHLRPSGSKESQSSMSAATKAGTMAPGAPGAGVIYGFAYYPASNQLSAPQPGALPAEIIDAVGESAAQGSGRPPALPPGAA